MTFPCSAYVRVDEVKALDLDAFKGAEVATSARPTRHPPTPCISFMRCSLCACNPSYAWWCGRAVWARRGGQRHSYSGTSCACAVPPGDAAPDGARKAGLRIVRKNEVLSWPRDTEGVWLRVPLRGSAVASFSLCLAPKKQRSQRGVIGSKNVGLESLLHSPPAGKSVFLFGDLEK